MEQDILNADKDCYNLCGTGGTSTVAKTIYNVYDWQKPKVNQLTTYEEMQVNGERKSRK